PGTPPRRAPALNSRRVPSGPLGWTTTTVRASTQRSSARYAGKWYTGWSGRHHSVLWTRAKAGDPQIPVLQARRGRERPVQEATQIQRARDRDPRRAGVP